MKNTLNFLFITLLLTCCNSTEQQSGNQDSSIAASKKETEKPHEVPESIRNSPLFSTEIVEPTQLFDNIYFVGYKGVGAFVINTTEGIILIDAMWTPEDAKNVIVPGINKLGLDPKDIIYLIVTHEHVDHYGGASFFEDTYKTKILMSKVAWQGLHDPNAEVLVDPFGNKSSDIPIPKAYQEIKDQEVVSLGETAIEVLLTPGHTKGAISLLISTTDHAVPHMAAVWGGTGLPKTLEANKGYLHSLDYFESVAIKNNVDAQLSNHPFANNLLDKMNALRHRKADEPNPVVISIESFKENIDSILRKNVQEKIDSFQ